MKTVNVVLVVLAVVSMTASAEIFSSDVTLDNYNNASKTDWSAMADDGRDVGVSTINAGVTVTQLGRYDFNIVGDVAGGPTNELYINGTLDGSSASEANIPDNDRGPDAVYIEIGSTGRWIANKVYGRGDTRGGEIQINEGGILEMVAWLGAFNGTITNYGTDSGDWVKDPEYWIATGWLVAAPGLELDVVYTDAAQGAGYVTAIIPEPATMSLLSLGALALLRKRK
jgi:hypothetical protein